MIPSSSSASQGQLSRALKDTEMQNQPPRAARYPHGRLRRAARPCAVREGRHGAVPFPLPAVPGLLSTWQRWASGGGVCGRQVTAVRDAPGAGTGEERRALGPGEGLGSGRQCRGVRRRRGVVRARGAAVGVRGSKGWEGSPGSAKDSERAPPVRTGVTDGSPHPAVVALAVASEAAFVEDLDES